MIVSSTKRCYVGVACTSSTSASLQQETLTGWPRPPNGDPSDPYPTMTRIHYQAPNVNKDIHKTCGEEHSSKPASIEHHVGQCWEPGWRLDPLERTYCPICYLAWEDLSLNLRKENRQQRNHNDYIESFANGEYISHDFLLCAAWQVIHFHVARGSRQGHAKYIIAKQSKSSSTSLHNILLNIFYTIFSQVTNFQISAH